MDNTLGHASKTGDSATLEYQQTGLQTENKTATAEKQQLPENDVLPEVGVDEREVTDPVTHLPITIHDATDVELECIPPPPSTPQLQPEEEDAQKLDSDKRHKAMEDLVEKETDGRWVDTDERERKTAFVAGAVATFGALVLFACTLAAAGRQGIWFGFVEVTIGVFGCGVVGLGTRFAVVGISVSGSQLHSKQEGEQEDPSICGPGYEDGTPPESAAWFNSLISSIWPIVNPALFASLTDMLEDVMQASLPKLVRGVRVVDLGQGNESVRILGIRWLEAGAAAEEKNGMKGEAGDFANFEIAIAYRARPTNGEDRALRKRNRNAHLLIEFWTIGGIRLPVWVELKGVLATARVRLQLTPNPPFLSMATLTLLGQPKVNVSCVPIAKNFLNVMDLPFVNRFLQSSIDEAVGNYVAPRSLTVDLKALLTGRERMDTEAVGVIVVRVIRAIGFKDGDGLKKWLKASARRGDPYVTVGWSKWGKAVWSTRVIANEGEPVWDETNTILVGPLEMNADERLMLKLWDSDRTTADDLLGFLEIPLKGVMSDPATKNRFSQREDGFQDSEGISYPGKLYWEVGYFEKTGLGEYLSVTEDPDFNETKKGIEEETESELRESNLVGKSSELKQQKKEDLKDRTNDIISASSPNLNWPSGILNIKIEQIVGLELDGTSKPGVKEEEDDEEAEDLPSAYCTVILNHQKIYKTRTKFKDSKPFFDAGTERFIRDLRTASVIISVRDHRAHESDPLLGVVVLPILEIFSSRTQFTTTYPLVGGIGHGRLRISLIFRSVRLSLPPPLLGWNSGTLEIYPHVTALAGLPKELAECRIIFRTLYGKRKLFPDPTSFGSWHRRGRDRPLRLAVCNRFSSCLLIKFRKYSIGPDITTAFGTLWLKDIVDDEEMDFEVLVRKGDMKRAVLNATEYGEVFGTLKLKVRFWPGLSGYHQGIASSDRNIADVMEVLDAAEDARELENHCAPVSGESYSSSSSSSDNDSGSDSSSGLGRRDEGRRGYKEELKEYKKNRKDIHRRHRGLMQWRGARKAAWVGQGVKVRSKGWGKDVKARWKHQPHSGSGDAVETEV